MKTELSTSDEWETPKELYDHLCEEYKLNPRIDVCATRDNKKCMWHFDKENDALSVSWEQDAWCNPPHSKTMDFVEKACAEWIANNINIMMIIPANSMCTNYSEKFIIPFADYFPINRAYCKFLFEGEFKDHSRNGYFVVIWRKQ